LISRTALTFDVEALLAAATAIFNNHSDNQFSLTHRPGAGDKCRDGNGSLFDFKNNVFLDRESSFTEFNDDFKASPFYPVYQTVQAWSPLKIGRVRLMRLPSHQCYSVHKDFDLRYHLALKTDPRCILYFAEEARGYHIPADGHLYLTDTRHHHTAFNGSPEERIHLVFTTYEAP
jgi:hypothetical protein